MLRMVEKGLETMVRGSGNESQGMEFDNIRKRQDLVEQFSQPAVEGGNFEHNLLTIMKSENMHLNIIHLNISELKGTKIDNRFFTGQIDPVTRQDGSNLADGPDQVYNPLSEGCHSYRHCISKTFTLVQTLNTKSTIDETGTARLCKPQTYVCGLALGDSTPQARNTVRCLA
jgi:hypothetical protein